MKRRTFLKGLATIVAAPFVPTTVKPLVTALAPVQEVIVPVTPLAEMMRNRREAARRALYENFESALWAAP